MSVQGFVEFDFGTLLVLLETVPTSASMILALHLDWGPDTTPKSDTNNSPDGNG